MVDALTAMWSMAQHTNCSKPIFLSWECKGDEATRRVAVVWIGGIDEFRGTGPHGLLADCRLDGGGARIWESRLEQFKGIDVVEDLDSVGQGCDLPSEVFTCSS